MGVSSIGKIKKILEKGKESIILDLGNVLHPKLEGIVVPFKLKNYEEVIKISSKFKVANEPVITEYVRINKAPKEVQKLYSESIPSERKGLPTYVLLCKTDKDSDKINVAKYRKKLFDVVIHLDMDYMQDEKTLWETWELKKNDYNGLVNLFSELIDDEEMVDTLSIIISILKEGVTDENTINGRVAMFKIVRNISKIEDENERKDAVEALQKAWKEMGEKEIEEVEVQEEVKKPKKTTKKKVEKEKEAKVAKEEIPNV